MSEKKRARVFQVGPIGIGGYVEPGPEDDPAEWYAQDTRHFRTDIIIGICIVAAIWILSALAMRYGK